MSKCSKNIIFVFAVFLLPFSAFAQVEITEIMYDLDGSDSGREWIEIYNTGNTDIDLADWKLYENKTNHTLAESLGGTVLRGSNFAVIADDPEKFLSDWPEFPGMVLDSSFSLKNTDGEAIALRNAALDDMDTVSYDPALGAAGDGDSLQRVNGLWIAAAPTPGAAAQSASEESGAQANKSSSTSNIPSVSGPAPVPQLSIMADAGGDRYVVAGADTIFEGSSTGTAGEPLDHARYFWNMGDGTVKEGKRISYVYRYPGTYTVVLNVSSGKYAAMDRISVTAETANIMISKTKIGKDGFIELHNGSDKYLDISFWHLRADGLHFTFPEYTYISPDTSVIFPSSVTGLFVKDNSDIALLYPNAAVAVEHEKKSYPQQGKTFPQQSYPQQGKTFTGTNTAIVPAARGNPPRAQGAEDLTIRKDNAGDLAAADKTMQDPVPASVLYTASNDRGNASPYMWFFVLFIVTFLAAGSVIFARRKETASVSSAVAIAKKIEMMED